MKSRLRSSFIHFAQGLLMGGADVIPGVSGGTMALIVGIYRRLISSLSSAFSGIVDALRLDGRTAQARFREVEWRLVLPLLAGIATAIIAGAHVIPMLMEEYPHQSLGLFFGLVAGSIAIPWQRIQKKTALAFSIAIVAAVVAFVLTGFPPKDGVDPGYVRVFLSAAVAICAMILPGVSGAFLLTALGVYEVTLHALTEGDVAYIAVFVFGAVVGLGLFSKLLNYLLERWSNVTMAALVGLMAGALRALWPWQADDRSLQLPQPGDPVLWVVVIAAAGFIFVTALAIFGDRAEARSSGLPS